MSALKIASTVFLAGLVLVALISLRGLMERQLAVRDKIEMTTLTPELLRARCGTPAKDEAYNDKVWALPSVEGMDTREITYSRHSPNAGDYALTVMFHNTSENPKWTLWLMKIVNGQGETLDELTKPEDQLLWLPCLRS